MTDSAITDQIVASPSGIREAARDFAMALAETPEFRAFQIAEEQLTDDQAAQQAIASYQSQQEMLRAQIQLRTITMDERTELQRMYQAVQDQPSVAAYVQAQADLKRVCQAAAAVISRRIGLTFASCKGGCH